MHASNLFRAFSSIIAVAVSVVLFVGCQKGPDENLDEDPPMPGSGKHRLKAIHIIEGLETEDTAYLIDFDYDGLNRVTKMAISTVGYSDLNDTWYYYKGDSKLPYLVVTMFDISPFDIYRTDSSFLEYDGDLIVYDSARIHNRPVNAPQNLEFAGYAVRQYSKVSDMLFRIKRLYRDAADPGNTEDDWEREVVIVDNSVNSFHCTINQLTPASSDFGYTKLEFSSFKNPLAGLIPAKIESELYMPNWYLISGFFPLYPSRSQNDPNDLYRMNHRVTVVKHVDGYPVHVRLENYNDMDDYPYETLLYEYE